MLKKLIFQGDAIFSEKCLQHYHSTMVKTHNDYRAKHNSPPLIGDTSLQNIARELAQKFADLDKQLVNQRRETQNLEHSKPDHLGHNVAMYSNPTSKFNDCDSNIFSISFIFYSLLNNSTILRICKRACKNLV